MLRIQDNIIIDFNYGWVKESEILNYFVNKDEQILFGYLLCNGSDSFVEERKILQNNETLYEATKNEPIIWYSPKNEKDLVSIIQRLGITYSCIILSAGETDVKKYRFQLEISEHGIFNEIELRALYINESIKGDFLKNIVPKLKRVNL